jgi:hypothetical protein
MTEVAFFHRDIVTFAGGTSACGTLDGEGGSGQSHKDTNDIELEFTHDRPSGSLQIRQRYGRVIRRKKSIECPAYPHILAPDGSYEAIIRIGVRGRPLNLLSECMGADVAPDPI